MAQFREYWLCIFSLLLSQTEGITSCKLLGSFGMPNLSKKGDIMIGGIFPVFNKQEDLNLFFLNRFDLRAFRWTQMMMFAIDEINKDNSLLPNISLGYQIYDSCASPTNSLRAALTQLNGQKQEVSEAECYPRLSAVIVSYFSTCACLSNKIKYPTFFRTVPSDYHQAKALASLVKHFGWSWVGAIQSDNDYGRNGLQAFSEEVQKIGVCISFIGTILRTYPRSKILRVVETIKQSSTRVILAFVPEGDLYPLMKEIVIQNITGIQWIASEAWVTAARPSTPEIFQSFGGAVGFATRKMAIPNLRDVLLNIRPSCDPGTVFVNDFWETIVGCNPCVKPGTVSSIACKGDQTVEQSQHPFFNVTELRVTYNVHKAVYAIAHALHSLIFCEKGNRNDRTKQCPLCCTLGAADCTPCLGAYWSNDAKDRCVPKEIEFLSYQETMGMTLTALSLMGACLAFAVMLVFLYFRHTPIVKSNNSELSSLLLLSLLLCFLCPFLFIGQPTVPSCMLRHTAFGLTFALCISCVLGKTMVVVTAFRARLPNNNVARTFGPVQQRIIVCSCTAVQVLICFLWLTLKPPFPQQNFKLSNRKIVLECNSGSEVAFYAVLAYIGLLSGVCLMLAFLARKLPDNFNEAKFITFSMLVFCAVWITFIPAYVSSPGKYTVTVEIFAILSSTFGLLTCIFAPKCYIILIKPEKNTKKHVMGKLSTKHL
uniref:G-protein coupled receptors family 3 profile domain-containing protein n=1 Tax=Scleropages formosus TaxID=113540 RepID=A0A8C9SD06_SCLFO